MTHAALLREVRAAYLALDRVPCQGTYGLVGQCCPLTALWAVETGNRPPNRPGEKGVSPIKDYGFARFGRWWAAGLLRSWDGLPAPADYAMAALDRPESNPDVAHYPGAGKEWLAGWKAGRQLARALLPLPEDGK